MSLCETEHAFAEKKENGRRKNAEKKSWQE